MSALCSLFCFLADLSPCLNISFAVVAIKRTTTKTALRTSWRTPSSSSRLCASATVCDQSIQLTPCSPIPTAQGTDTCHRSLVLADVSPPPPPPMEMSAYQDLVDDDPEGFIEVRRRLEGWFPKLSHVATSSMGASIGGYIADFTVTPQAITYAARHPTPGSHLPLIPRIPSTHPCLLLVPPQARIPIQPGHGKGLAGGARRRVEAYR